MIHISSTPTFSYSRMEVKYKHIFMLRDVDSDRTLTERLIIHVELPECLLKEYTIELLGTWPAVFHVRSNWMMYIQSIRTWKSIEWITDRGKVGVMSLCTGNEKIKLLNSYRYDLFHKQHWSPHFINITITSFIFPIILQKSATLHCDRSIYIGPKLCLPFQAIGLTLLDGQYVPWRFPWNRYELN